jgi:hypothetical protein
VICAIGAHSQPEAIPLPPRRRSAVVPDVVVNVHDGGVEVGHCREMVAFVNDGV